MDDVKVVTVGGSGTGMVPGQEIEGVTPSGQPNVAVRVVGPIVAIAVRFGHLYFLTLVGIVVGAMTATGGGEGASQLMPYSDFADLVWKAAKMSLAVPGVGLLKDLVTIFGRLENKFPFLTGQV